MNKKQKNIKNDQGKYQKHAWSFLLNKSLSPVGVMNAAVLFCDLNEIIFALENTNRLCLDGIGSKDLSQRLSPWQSYCCCF